METAPASTDFTARRQVTGLSETGEMASTSFHDRSEPSLSAIVGSTKVSGARRDRVQGLVTATYEDWGGRWLAGRERPLVCKVRMDAVLPGSVTRHAPIDLGGPCSTGLRRLKIANSAPGRRRLDLFRGGPHASMLITDEAASHGGGNHQS